MFFYCVMLFVSRSHMGNGTSLNVISRTPASLSGKVLSQMKQNWWLEIVRVNFVLFVPRSVLLRWTVAVSCSPVTPRTGTAPYARIRKIRRDGATEYPVN